MSEDIKALDKEVELLDSLIKSKSEIIELAKSPAYSEVLKSFNEEKLSALQDYLKDNSPVNQSYARLWNFICNILELFKNPTELDNLLAKKEELMSQLDKVKEIESSQSFDQQSGGAL